MSQHNKRYPGIDNDVHSGMTDIGKIIRDAWTFGILPETEHCVNWDYGRLEQLYDQVHQAWAPYGHLASHLPDELREKHERIYSEAIVRARTAGWNVELGDDD
ncbi:MAG: hypothetical protein HZB57_03190 [Gammaproteobacteria bacterium]|nr:hypothetical protein [Gammaproteobacteria bacterium]